MWGCNGNIHSVPERSSETMVNALFVSRSGAVWKWWRLYTEHGRTYYFIGLEMELEATEIGENEGVHT